MPINPVTTTATETAAEAAHKRVQLRGERDDGVRAAAAAAAAPKSGPPGQDDGLRETKKVVEVQRQEGKSAVRQTIDKFA